MGSNAAGPLPAAPVRSAPVAVGPAYRALVPLGAYGGLRIGEMAGLRRKRLDLAAGMVEIAEVVTEMHGHLYLGPPKTTAGRRRVGLPRVVVEALQEHLAGRAVEPDSFVFSLSNGGPLRTASFRTRVWRPATRAAGLEGLRIHDLQHTAVALWIAAGAGPKDVAVRAGHTSVSFTLDRYGHLYPEGDRALRDRLDRFHEAAGDGE
jgi:integrase